MEKKGRAASSSSQPMSTYTTKPNWLELPRDITASILQRLDVFTILTRARRVCSLWWNVCKDPFMWRTIEMDLYFLYHLRLYHSKSLRAMCRCAVDLSCGQLEDISIYNFGTDELLNYIANSGNHLCRIEIDDCVEVSEEGMCEIAKKFPFLEELCIRGSFSKHALEVLGRSCPLLKSLTYEGQWGKTIEECDEEAFAIAKTMPGLCYLDIFGNSLSDVGLTAILDGCPLLKSLDIRQCHNLDFSDSLWKRCQDQIKDLLSNFDLDIEYEDSDDKRTNGSLTRRLIRELVARSSIEMVSTFQLIYTRATNEDLDDVEEFDPTNYEYEYEYEY